MGAIDTQPVRRATTAAKVRAEVLDCRILIVDDDQFNRELIAMYLAKRGFTRLEFAEDGISALQQIEKQSPDLLILDIMMPGVDGFEVCRRLRALPDGDALPILVQTGLDKPEDRVRVFEVGATDLVAKPINRFELLARVIIHLEHRLLVRGLREYRKAMKREMASAREMQHALMPQGKDVRQIEQRYNVEIASYFQSSSEIGGDLWGAVALNDTQFGVYTVDFSGHGVASALNTFRLHTILENLNRSCTDPAVILAEMNGRLCHLLARGQFATMLFGVVDVARDTFSYAAAASPRPFLRAAPGAAATLLDGAGVPLGISVDAKYDLRQVPFAPGGLVLAYSDALIEAPRADETLFDETALTAIVAANRDVAGAADFLDDTLSGVLEQINFPLSDDLTVVCVRRNA